MSMTKPAALGFGLVAIATVSLVACGGSSKSSDAAAKPSATSSPSSSSGAGGRAGGGFLQNPQIEQCLKAAGISLPTASGSFPRPSGSFSRRPRPSGSFSRPTNFPSGARPSNFPSGARGGFFGGNSAQAQQIQQALKACGITLPSFGAGRGGSGAAATPSAAATG